MRIDLTLQAPDGSERDIAVLAEPGTALRDVLPLLREAAGCGGADVISCGGSALDPQLRVEDALRPGSVIRIGSVPVITQPGGLLVRVVGGAHAGRIVTLTGDLLIGRDAHCDLRIEDPDVSRRHALLTVGPGGVRVRDLGSTNGTWLDGRRITSTEVVGADALLRVGDTYLGVGWPQASTEAFCWPAPIELPAELPAATAPPVQWLAILAPAIGGALLAWLTHSVLFLLMAALSPVAALAGVFGERWQGRRSTRRAIAELRLEADRADGVVRAELAAEERRRRAVDPDASTVAEIAVSGHRLWSRSHTSPGFLRIRIGLGTSTSWLQVRRSADVRAAGTVRDVPIVVDAAAGPVGLIGPPGLVRGLASWVVIQLATWCPPSELCIVPVLGDPDRWQWLRWLPHVVPAGDAGAALARIARTVQQRREQAWDGSWLLALVDPTAATELGRELGELLRDTAAVGVTAICLGVQDSRLRAACSTVISPVDEVVAEGVDDDWAQDAARALARAEAGQADAGPVTLTRLLGRPDVAAIRENWACSDGRAAAVIGRAGGESFEVDLVRDGPHALVAGTTGAGKSELLRTWVASLAARHPPPDVAFVLIDYKGGAAFGACERLPHVLGLVTDLDQHAVRRALTSLRAELRRRETLFSAAGLSQWSAYRAAGKGEMLPRLLLVVDEFAALAAELPDFVSGLVSIAQRGRSLGVHLILATQRPGGVVSPEIRANTALRIALRTTTPAESLDVIDSPVAASIQAADHGHAYAQLGTALFGFRTGYAGGTSAEAAQVVPLLPWRTLPPQPPVDAGAATDLDLLVERIVEAARGITPQRRPWLPPLPTSIAWSTLPPSPTGVAIGMTDLPGQQSQEICPLDLEAGGSVLLIGGAQSGRTTALVTIAGAAAARHAPGGLELYVLRRAGSALEDLAVLPHTAACLDLDDAATIERFLRRLDVELSRRRRSATGGPAAVLLVDGWEELAALDDATGRCTSLLLGLLRVAGASSLTVVVSGDRGALSPRVASWFQTRFVLPLTDPADYALAGISPKVVPAHAVPGRAIRAVDGLEVQFAHLGATPGRWPARQELDQLATRYPAQAGATREWQPVRARALPARVPLQAAGGAGLRVVLGVGGDAAEPILVDLSAGARRLLVAGACRSGRSTALRTIAAQLGSGLDVVTAAPLRSPLQETAAERGWPLVTPDAAPEVLTRPPNSHPTVLLVDDLEAFDETPAGALLVSWAAAPQAAVVAAGRSDDLLTSYRGLGPVLRRAGCALLLQPGAADGELAGIRLARVPPPTVPGRGVLVPDPGWIGSGATAEPIPIQVAMP